MAATYILKVITDFSSAHTLRGYPGACQRMHGHNWKLEIEVTAKMLNSLGIAIDFKEIKHYARTLCAELDHQYLNEIPPFNEINPTAENIAAFFYHRLGTQINSEHIWVSSITLWETDRACVRYTEEP
ncbi:6-carboxytetrahydropterin synthase QueD [Candidatus Nitrosacidococcus tergens]|uniref:6-carboxy-5,6,7,8-tetrahydropterin synthase n=1 Tax=Candidatus Nitrosacidococcus tergens TaxID=553981 RepID=A0A7G1Q8C4_9GAMM|nr:6-carboxytetrahydropterin synthase QueD [Candidatus Nitrosacidococcus tergens]CAB1274932.1 6-carboxy-5,6,7,8-tetrahydropterin synthase [Candidatus Nitrosacidococcus tergens]